MLSLASVTPCCDFVPLSRPGRTSHARVPDAALGQHRDKGRHGACFIEASENFEIVSPMEKADLTQSRSGDGTNERTPMDLTEKFHQDLVGHHRQPTTPKQHYSMTVTDLM